MPNAPADLGWILGNVAADHVQAGYREPWLSRWPGVPPPPMFAFRDRDGNGLEIVEEGSCLRRVRGLRLVKVALVAGWAVGARWPGRAVCHGRV
jgi:hypothetical protein